MFVVLTKFGIVFDMLPEAPPTDRAPNTATGVAASPDGPKDRHDLMRRAGSLSLMAIILIVVVGVLSVLLLRRHRARIAAGSSVRNRRRRPPPPDPWFESGRRISPGGLGGLLPGSEDDTVDIDPDDLSPHDIEGGNDDGPNDRGPNQ